MDCPQCGKPNKPNATFCNFCGALLAQPPATPAPKPASEKKKGPSTGLIVAIVIVALLALLGCCCLVAGGGLALFTMPTTMVVSTSTRQPAPRVITPVPTRVEITAAPRPQLRVGLVTDAFGKVYDKGFNEAAWNALGRAQRELGAETSHIESQNPQDYDRNIAFLADQGYDVIVTSGFALGEATARAAARYPHVRFIGTDQYQDQTLPNYAGLIFAEDQGGFLAGALAALMSQSGTVGAVLGTDVVPPVVRFGKGYENGARYINPNIMVILTYHPGDVSRAFTDPEWGRQTAWQQIGQGADVIFGAGGETGNGAIIAAAEKGVHCIGVDMDQWYTVPEARPYLLSSAMKLITPGTFKLIKAAQEGTFQGGNVVGDMGLAPFHDTESRVPAAVKTRLQEIAQGLQDGSIRTGVSL